MHRCASYLTVYGGILNISQSLVLLGIVFWESAWPSQCIGVLSPIQPRSSNYSSIRLEYCAWKATGTLVHDSLCDSEGTIVH